MSKPYWVHSGEPELRKFVAPEIIFGVGALHLAGQFARNLGGSKALVVSDPGVLAAGWTQQVLESIEGAGLESTLFTEVTPNPRIEEAAAGAAACTSASIPVQAARNASMVVRAWLSRGQTGVLFLRKSRTSQLLCFALDRMTSEPAG